MTTRLQNQVDPLRCGFCGDHNGRVVAEIFDKGGALVGGGRVADPVRARVAFQPALVNLFRFRIGVTNAGSEDDPLIVHERDGQ